MSTRLTYRTAVQLRGYDALATATIDAAVEEARRRVLTDRRWSFLESSNATLATVANVATVSLSTLTTLAYIDAIRLSNVSGSFECAYRPRTIIRDLQDRYGTTGYTGTPQFWTRVGGTITFWPTPTAIYTVTVEGIENPTALAADASVCVIPDKHAELVTWAAVVPLAFRQRDLAASSAADQFYSKVLLPRHAGQDGLEQRQTSEQVRTGFWGD